MQACFRIIIIINECIVCLLQGKENERKGRVFI